MHARVNHNPSEKSAGDELVVKMPQQTSASVMYRNSLNLTYNYELDADATEADILDHLTSAIVERFKMTIKGQTVFDTSNYHHLAIFREFWHLKHRYSKELTERGIQSAATKKKRHNIDGAAADTLASIHKKRYSFHLGSFLTDAAFTPQAIRNNVEFYIKLAAGKYSLKNICLEYDYILNQSIANDITQKYTNHRHIFNDYKSHTTTDVKAEESEFEININATYESLRAVLVFFKANNDASVEYLYPNITNVKVDIDGTTNQLFTSDYLAPYAYQDAKKIFEIERGEMFINQESFYTDKYCLPIDLRTINDERSSGIGRQVKDYIKLKISKGATTAACKAFVYLVTDKAVNFVNNELNSILQ
jgi:hypothetical protein